MLSDKENSFTQIKSLRRTPQILKILSSAAIYAAVIIVWQIVYYLLTQKNQIVKEYIFPNPLGVVQATGKLIKNGMLFSAIFFSLRKMLTGYVISLFVGIITGLIITSSKFISRTFKPLILGLQTLPSICWIPFAMLWFGLSEGATLFVIVIGSSFSVCIAVESAIKNVNPLYIKAARTMGAGKSDIYTRVILPASIPEFISGIKQGWSFAWRALMAGEMMSGTMGLGFILQNGRDLLEINQVMAVMIIIVMISVLTEKLIFGRIEQSTRKKMGL